MLLAKEAFPNKAILIFSTELFIKIVPGRITFERTNYFWDITLQY